MAVIEATNIEKVFDKGGAETFALRGASLAIEKGEFIAIVGPSGSGKSTMLQILGLLDAPTGGTYKLFGKNVLEMSDVECAALRNEKIGFIFQSFNLLARTSVLDNVELPLAYSNVPRQEWEQRAREKIEAVGLTHRIEHESSELSGGERQRVAIARALVNDPDIVFADEPTGNLDSVSGLAVMEILERMHHDGHTIILITHDRQLARRAHRAVLIKDGKVVWDGDAQQIPEY